MIDSMIQLQLRQQELLGKANQAGKIQGQEPACEDKKLSEDCKDDHESFWERMERIRDQRREREERLREIWRKKQRKKRWQEEYEKQMRMRQLRRQALLKQSILKKIEGQQILEERAEKTMQARSTDGRLPVSAQIRGPRVIRVKVISDF